jgi:hypothetical protein
MPVTEAGFEQILGTVDKLSSDELELLQERIAQSRRKKAPSTSRGYPDEARELFAIPFDKYLAMSDDERDAIAFRAYKILDRWIDHQLKARRAKWMLVCGGEILDASPKFIEYPAPEKLMTIGKDRGLIPFVFIYTPLIEESSWSDLQDSDYYPTLPMTVGRFGAKSEKIISDGVTIEADFDTGSPELLLDYDQMVSNGVIGAIPIKQAHHRPHLGEFYPCHLLPIAIGITDDNGQTLTKDIGALFVRNWRQSPLCLVNPSREALAGRNLLFEFPLRVVLDGEKKTTQIIGKKTVSKKPGKRKS